MSKRYKNILEMVEDIASPEFTLDVAKYMVESTKDENRQLRALLLEARDMLKKVYEILEGKELE